MEAVMFYRCRVLPLEAGDGKNGIRESGIWLSGDRVADTAY